MLTRRPADRVPTEFRRAMEWLGQDPWYFELSPMTRGALSPSIDVKETDDALVIEAELPGVKPDDIDVSIEGRTLAIRAKVDQASEREADDGRYLIRERQAASFSRVVMLPTEVDSDKATLTYDNGELSLTLPKATERRSRKIPVTAGSKGSKSVGPGNGHKTGEGSTPINKTEPVTAGTQRR